MCLMCYNYRDMKTQAGYIIHKRSGKVQNKTKGTKNMKYRINYDELSLKEKVMQTFVITIREINKHGGPEEFFKKYKVGGMYYSESKDPDIENRTEMSLRTYPKRLNECKKYSQIPLFICADSTPLPGQTEKIESRSLGGTRSEKDAYNYGKLIGMQQNANGMDWVLWPDIDMYFSRFMKMFATSDDPVLTAKLYRQVVRGIQDQGVCATVKHFPGLGTQTDTNMHIAPGENTLGLDEWMNSYGYVYSEMFKENAACVMTTHITLASYDNDRHDGFYPIATYSEKLTKGLLKDKLGFKGAVVTDALIMGGMATGDLVKETVQAFKAGADWLLWPPIEAADAIAEAIESGEIPMSRLDDALSRIDKMRKLRENALNNKSFDEPNADFANEIAKDITRRGICLRRNEAGLIPISKEMKKILILSVTEKEDTTNLIRDAFEKKGFTCDVLTKIYDEEFNVCWQDDIDELQDKYNIVIFAVDTEQKTWGDEMMMIWASHLFDKKKKIIVNFSSPFYADIMFPEDPTIIDVNTDAFETSINAVVDGIIGDMSFCGYPVVKNIKLIK